MARTTTTTIGRMTVKKATWSLLLVLALMLATLLVATPAIAQVEQETGQESESGDVEINAGVANKGGYASQCAPALQFGQSGNFNNAPASLQYAGEADDFEPGGIEFTAGPGLAAECDQKIQQSAAASSAPKTEEKEAKEKKVEEKKAAPTPPPKAEAKAAEAPKAQAPKAEAKTSGVEAKTSPKTEQIKKAAPKELPKTGGVLPILGLAGALLIGGGLLIRKLAR